MAGRHARFWSQPNRFGYVAAVPTKEIMNRGGWKSVAMVVRYEHASEERDAQLAQALNAFTAGDNVVPITHERSGDRAGRAVRVRGKVRCWTYRR